MEPFDDELYELLFGGPKQPMEDLPLYGKPLYGPSPILGTADAIKKDQAAREFLHPEPPPLPTK